MAHIHELIDLTLSVYIVHKNKVLMIDHKTLGTWLPIGGHVELDEDTDEAIEREIKEESGLSVKLYGSRHKKLSENSKPLTVPQFIDIHRIEGKHRHLNLTFFAYSKSDKVKLASKEHNDIKWFTAKELKSRDLRIRPWIRIFALQALKFFGKK